MLRQVPNTLGALHLREGNPMKHSKLVKRFAATAATAVLLVGAGAGAANADKPADAGAKGKGGGGNVVVQRYGDWW